MQKVELARQLRDRQVRGGHYTAEALAAVSDDEIIDSYVTCSCCGAKEAEGEALEQIIAEATGAESFFDLLGPVHEHPESLEPGAAEPEAEEQ